MPIIQDLARLTDQMGIAIAFKEVSRQTQACPDLAAASRRLPVDFW